MSETFTQARIFLMWKEIDALRVVWVKFLDLLKEEEVKGRVRGFLEKVAFRQLKIGWISK
jgi:hypothetical protein